MALRAKSGQILRSCNTIRRGAALLHILQHPAPELRSPCRPIRPEEFRDGSLFPLAKEMLRLMIEHQGAGLAAPQVGRLIQLIVASPCVTGDPRHVMALANPVLVGACAKVPVIGTPGVEIGTEGCLSIERGDKEGEVPRWSKSRICFQRAERLCAHVLTAPLSCHSNAFRFDCRGGPLRRPDSRWSPHRHYSYWLCGASSSARD